MQVTIQIHIDIHFSAYIITLDVYETYHPAVDLQYEMHIFEHNAFNLMYAVPLLSICGSGLYV